LSKDLVVLVADKSMSAAVGGILKNPVRLGIREIEFLGPYAHPKNDPGVYQQAHDFLRPFHREAAYAIALFDRGGCGSSLSREELELEVETRLVQNGWRGRCAAISIEPELENWVWSDSPRVEAALGWPQGQLRTWLTESNMWPSQAQKPPQPKEAVEAALRYRKIPRSSSIYNDLAINVSFARCTDPAFVKLRSTLATWFPRPIH
jgi:hypothetical protein